MKLSITAMNVIVDTMYGSLSIKDGGRLFKYGQQTREEVAKKLAEELNNMFVTIEPDKGVETKEDAIRSG